MVDANVERLGERSVELALQKVERERIGLLDMLPVRVQGTVVRMVWRRRKWTNPNTVRLLQVSYVAVVADVTNVT
jgi:hypothetical protein